MIAIITFAIVAISCLVYALFEPRRIQIKREKCVLSDLPTNLSGMKIGLITDIHVDSKRDFNFFRTQLHAMQEMNPDILLLGGDYSDSPVHMRRVLREAGQVKTTVAVIGVRGNHDKCVDQDTFRRYMMEAGIVTGLDEAFSFDFQGQPFTVVCLDDYELGDDSPERAFDLVSAKPNVFTICLAHQPKSIVMLKEHEARAKVDIAFCGHTHAGQVTFFGLWGIRTFRKIPLRKNQWVNMMGVKTMESNGLGQRWPIRFFAVPQIHLITLQE